MWRARARACGCISQWQMSEKSWSENLITSAGSCYHLYCFLYVIMFVNAIRECEFAAATGTRMSRAKCPSQVSCAWGGGGMAMADANAMTSDQWLPVIARLCSCLWRNGSSINIFSVREYEFIEWFCSVVCRVHCISSSFSIVLVFFFFISVEETRVVNNFYDKRCIFLVREKHVLGIWRGKSTR